MTVNVCRTDVANAGYHNLVVHCHASQVRLWELVFQGTSSADANHLAALLYKAVMDLGGPHKVSGIVMDNASVNGAAVRDLNRRLRSECEHWMKLNVTDMKIPAGAPSLSSRRGASHTGCSCWSATSSNTLPKSANARRILQIPSRTAVSCGQSIRCTAATHSRDLPRRVGDPILPCSRV